MPTVLITGSSRGLGLEFARQYAAAGWRVIATCRKPKDATALAGIKGDVSIHPLDVTDPHSIQTLQESLGDFACDLLISNAGVFGPPPQRFGGLNYQEWEDVLRINTLAPMRIAEAFVGAIERSNKKTMVFITSRMGSIEDNESGNSYAYRTSKAALNAAVKTMAIDLAARKVISIVIHPGWVRTDMGGKGAPLTPQESVTEMRQVIDGLSLTDNGKFYAYDGVILPW